MPSNWHLFSEMRTPTMSSKLLSVVPALRHRVKAVSAKSLPVELQPQDAVSGRVAVIRPSTWLVMTWYWIFAALLILVLAFITLITKIVVNKSVRAKKTMEIHSSILTSTVSRLQQSLTASSLCGFEFQQRPEGYNTDFVDSYNTWLPPDEEQDVASDSASGAGSENPAISTDAVKYASLRVFTGTWNVGDRSPAYDRLRDWFFGEEENVGGVSAPYDIMAIGAQECSYQPRFGYDSCEKDWASAITEAVGPDFELVSATSLRDSIRLLLFVRRRLLHQVHSIRSSTYSTTIPMFWRKGGVGVQMSYLSTTLVFVSCHLAAHETKLDGRNADIGHIMKSLNLGNPNYDAGHQFDHCFFLGDLNYRIESLKWEEANRLIQKKEWSELIANDQLKKEQSKGNILYGFYEPPITFAPTFKVERGTRDKFNKRRTPSWCDRVLVHSLPNCVATAVSYKSVDTILSSDHVPVFADWKVQVPIIRLKYRDEAAVRTFLTSTTRALSPFTTNSPGMSRVGSSLTFSGSDHSSNDLTGSQGALGDSTNSISPLTSFLQLTAPKLSVSNSSCDLNHGESVSNPEIIHSSTPIAIEEKSASNPAIVSSASYLTPPAANSPSIRSDSGIDAISSVLDCYRRPTTSNSSGGSTENDSIAALQSKSMDLSASSRLVGHSKVASQEWSFCTQVVNPDAAKFEIRLTNVSFTLTPNATFKKFSTPEICPRILISSPMVESVVGEPVRSSILSALDETWFWDALPCVYTKTLTPTALAHHHMFLAVYHHISDDNEKNVAHAVISLKNFLAAPALFELPLIYCGVRKGTIQGSLAIRRLDPNEAYIRGDLIAGAISSAIRF